MCSKDLESDFLLVGKGGASIPDRDGILDVNR